MGNGGWHLSSKTVCPVCGEKINRKRADSYACPAPDFQPRHFRCVYPEMAVTAGDAVAAPPFAPSPLGACGAATPPTDRTAA